MISNDIESLLCQSHGRIALSSDDFSLHKFLILMSLYHSNTAFLAKGPSNAQHITTPAAFNVAHKSPLFMSAVEDAPVTTALEDYVKSRGGDRVIKKILIANNGMAATKSILSMRQWAYKELGDEKAISFVAMATPE
eukprot:CAMPEP_0204633336 /NCGR_PEP_ID=MMETSP0717-20131115/26949_1 /ASSEMBLY_ACC=CAM_ASM_000666 /TAXON_ID=230516 /ORGANISM="Chaetoceros curvisetus" /LENGTH=136 /DNA_ID=CAMNT_0051651461 /DNA_START=469 /DNA_END=877 /DNA_ORIENTATION=-